MDAYIILVGTELLNGAMVDTNSIYIAEELNKLGIELKGKSIVADNIDQIEDMISYAKQRAELIILSGGLGPTIDDLTKDAIANHLGKDLVVDKKHLEEMKRKFSERGIPVLAKNEKEVMVVEGSEVFLNEQGIAPGFLVDDIAAFPGVPVELKNLFPKFLSYINEREGLNTSIYIRDLVVFGIPESVLEEKILDIFEETSFTLEFLVKDYGIIVRLLGTERDSIDIGRCIGKVEARLGNNLISTNGMKVEEVLLEKLNEFDYNIKLAESCTGGMIASTLVSLPGISRFFQESLVTYSNEAKVERLGVREKTLDRYGAVSEETVKEMLLGLDSDTAIAVSGIAGPGGGTLEKPVGTVYIGVRVREEIRVKKYEIKGEREKVRKRSTYSALFDLLNMLK